MTTRTEDGLLAVPLMDHQQVAVAHLLRHPRTALCDGVGLGKGATALGLIAALRQQDARLRALVLVPAAMEAEWMAQIARFLPDVSAGTLRKPDKGASGPPTVLVASYGMAQSKKLDPRDFGVVILDEAAEFKTGPAGQAGASATWKWVQGFATRIPVAVALTATPVENHPLEAHAVLSAIGADVPSLSEFAGAFHWTDYGAAGRAPGDFLHDTAAAWVADVLGGSILRRTVADVGLKLPTHVGDRVAFVDLTPAQLHDYERARRWRGRYGHQKREQAGRSSGGASALAQAALPLLLGSGDHVIGYAENPHVHEAIIGPALDSARAHWLLIDGSTEQGKRDRYVAAFKSDDGPRILLGTRVLERGLNLQHCRRMVSLDASDNPAREAQREGRVRRLGSPHDTYEHLTLLPNTPDAHAKWKRLQTKRTMADRIGLGLE
ncbi:MAG: helicase-related protein [Candidatus Nanopelagicales bacterium]